MYENSAIGVALISLQRTLPGGKSAPMRIMGYGDQREEFRKLTFLEITEEDYRDPNLGVGQRAVRGYVYNSFQIEKQYRMQKMAILVGQQQLLLWFW